MNSDMYNVVGLQIVGCLLFVSFQPIQASQTEVESSLPNGHSLFLSSLSLVFYTHTPIVVYICFIATENSSVFNLCCNTITFIPSADHSLKPQALAIILLHMYDTDICTHTHSRVRTHTHIHTHTHAHIHTCLLYTSPSPRDRHASRMPSSA